MVTLRSDRRVRGDERRPRRSGAKSSKSGGRQRGRGWLDYVQGVTASSPPWRQGAAGFDVHIESTIPLGAGVSSSAALEVSLLRALRMLLVFDETIWSLARMAQSVETDFVGAPVGIMDQMAVSLGREGERSSSTPGRSACDAYRSRSSVEIIVIDSGVPHAHADGEYATRRRESFDAAARLGVDWLRDLDTTALPRIEALPRPLARRARHVVTENAACARNAVDALRRRCRALGALFPRRTRRCATTTRRRRRTSIGSSRSRSGIPTFTAPADRWRLRRGRR